MAGAFGAGTALATILLAASLPAQAQGWKAETTQAIPKSPPKQQQRKSQRAGAKKPGKTQERLTNAPVDAPPPAAAPVEEPPALVLEHGGPVTAEAEDAKPAPSKPALAKPAPATAATPAPAPPPTASAAKPVPPSVQSGPLPLAKTVTADDDPEPDDPFVDVRIVERAAKNDVAITAAAETIRPGAEVGPASQTPAGQYCTNIADAAIDARIAWQRQNLAEAEKAIQQKATELEAKTAEFQRWLQRRDEFVEKAKKTVVDIYTKMKPDAAALQLQALDEETAAAVLVKLDPRTASAVMNEMDPLQAARLTSIISGASKLPRAKAAPQAGRS